MSRRLILVPIVTTAILAACGGDVVSDPTGGASEGSAGPGGASGGGSTTGEGAGGRGGGGTTSSAQGSSSSGIPDVCTGQPCGIPCTVCNDVECLTGFCNAYGACDLPAVVCMPKDPGQPCPSATQAPAVLCAGCGGGKGCTFFGCVIGGPDDASGSCCYDVVGGCAPNP